MTVDRNIILVLGQDTLPLGAPPMKIQEKTHITRASSVPNDLPSGLECESKFVKVAENQIHFYFNSIC